MINPFLPEDYTRYPEWIHYRVNIPHHEQIEGLPLWAQIFSAHVTAVEMQACLFP